MKALQRRGFLKENRVTGIREFDLGSVSNVAMQATREESNSTSGGDGVAPLYFSRKSNHLCQTAAVVSVVCVPSQL